MLGLEPHYLLTLHPRAAPHLSSSVYHPAKSDMLVGLHHNEVLPPSIGSLLGNLDGFVFRNSVVGGLVAYLVFVESSAL
jgi:hypothetical protein